ncbi:MAG TPA: hypothetical protein PK530_17715 [Anaerolineales bacterium]|nr:hypothetical protein [Anaerolineales bacterium]
MPAYYWIQLYKNPTENTLAEIVQKTVDGLVESGCEYRFSEITTIYDDTLPEMQQVPISASIKFDLNEAVSYAIKDLQNWTTTGKGKQWLPGIQLFFEFDFHFDEKILMKLGKELNRIVKQVTLTFWVKEDQIFGDKITLSIHTWEEYVLMYGQEETHQYNKSQILKMVENVCNQVTPHFGWLDDETRSSDFSYELLVENKWHVKNEYIIVGPQLRHKINQYNPESTPNFVKKLPNGSLVLRRLS